MSCENSQAQNKNHSEAFTVVIDAGHGGKDAGAVYGGVLEKNVNLAVALKFGKLISDNCSDVKVIYTRKTDVFLGLDERGGIANKANASLFISLHADAVDKKPSVNGASTYIMGMDKTENNLREAMRENAVMKYEDDYTEKYEGFDPTSAESYIIFNLMQYAYFDRSLQLARIIQRHYCKNTTFTDRGAKQGPFYVLWKPAMPSVLTEMGFVSNESDRKYMTSEKGQNAIAKSLFNAFVEYRELADKKISDIAPADPADATQAQAAPGHDEQRPAPTGQIASGVGFYVQLCASRTSISGNDGRFGQYRGKVVEKKTDGWYKYYIGSYEKLEDAVAVRDQVKRGDFRDAFVIALDGDKQITVDEARSRIAAENK